MKVYKPTDRQTHIYGGKQKLWATKWKRLRKVTSYSKCELINAVCTNQRSRVNTYILIQTHRPTAQTSYILTITLSNLNHSVPLLPWWWPTGTPMLRPNHGLNWT